MRKMTFEELREKEVINCRDCAKLGYVADCELDAECGKIISLLVLDQGKKFCFAPKPENCIVIFWDAIQKIGDDIILVDIELKNLPIFPDDKKGKKRFF